MLPVDAKALAQIAARLERSAEMPSSAFQVALEKLNSVYARRVNWRDIEPETPEPRAMA